MRSARLVLIPVAMVLLASCAEDDGSGAADGGGDLEGITWILDTSAAAELGEAPEEATATIRFDGDQVGGSAFCNSFGGAFEADGDGSMSIETGAMTQMACEEPLMSLETAYVAALGQVISYEVGDDTLTLGRDGGSALTYTAQQHLPLEGTAWRLDGITTGTDAVSSTLAGTEVTATFADDGTLSGNGGCNQYNTGYTVDGDALAVDGGIMSTKMACEQDVMDQEAAYLAALAETATFEIEGSTLTLSDADGGFLLSFVAGAA